MANSNLETKNRMEKAVGAGDWATVRECMHPDFVLYEPAEFPFGGAWRGPDGLKAMHAKAAGAIRSVQVTYMSVLVDEADPDRIACYLRLQGEVTATGAPFDSTICEVIEFKDGKVFSGKPHWFDPPAWS